MDFLTVREKTAAEAHGHASDIEILDKWKHYKIIALLK